MTTGFGGVSATGGGSTGVGVTTGLITSLGVVAARSCDDCEGRVGPETKPRKNQRYSIEIRKSAAEEVEKTKLSPIIIRKFNHQNQYLSSRSSA